MQKLNLFLLLPLLMQAAMMLVVAFSGLALIVSVFFCLLLAVSQGTYFMHRCHCCYVYVVYRCTYEWHHEADKRFVVAL